MANPVIANSYAANAQTVGIAPTGLFTALGDGVFRVSFYCAISSVAGRVTVKLHFTDDHAARVISFDPASPGSPATDSITFKTKTGDVIAIEAAVGGDSVTFDLYAITESF